MKGNNPPTISSGKAAAAGKEPDPGQLPAESEADLKGYWDKACASGHLEILGPKAQDTPETIISTKGKNISLVKCGSCIIYPWQ